jgi:hypothetical protein
LDPPIRDFFPPIRDAAAVRVRSFNFHCRLGSAARDSDFAGPKNDSMKFYNCCVP